MTNLFVSGELKRFNNEDVVFMNKFDLSKSGKDSYRDSQLKIFLYSREGES